MIQYGDAGSIPQLKKLWKACFSDPDAYIDAFFAALYEDENLLLAKEDGVLLGASFFLPGSICLKQGAKETCSSIRYVYALAVFPKFRGRGIAGNLLRCAYERFSAPLIAQPAEESLAGGFYEPLGFSKAFYVKKQQAVLPQYDLQAAEIAPDENLEVYPVEAAEYNRIREAHFGGHGFVSWPLCHISFALEEHRGSGGDALLVVKKGREDILLYYQDEGEAVITETTLQPQEAARVLAGRLAEPCRSLIVQKPFVRSAGFGQQEGDRRGLCTQDVRLMGEAFGLPPLSGYLNLTLD